MNTAPQAATQAGGTDLDLLPCPFCGGTEAFVERLDYSAAYVQCDSRINEHDACLARGPIGVQDDDGEEIPGAAAAIRAWNEQAARRASPQPVAPDDLRTDYLADSHYLDGLRAGWNMGVAGDDAAFDSIVATRGEQLREARRELRAAQPVALDEQAMRAAFKKWHDENGDQDCGYTWQEAWKTALAGIRPAQIADDHAGDELALHEIADLIRRNTRYELETDLVNLCQDVERQVKARLATQPPTAPVLEAPTLYVRQCDIDGTMPGSTVVASKVAGEEWTVPYRAAQQAATCKPASDEKGGA